MSFADQPWWKTQGVFFAGGWHPLPARIRAGNIPANAEEEYAFEYTEPFVQRLKELGIALMIGQYDRGLGNSDQAEQQELTRRQAEYCHKYGIYYGVYMANTVYFESVMKDNPECEDWVVKTYDGRFAHYGGEQTWRWVACFNSPGWRERMKRQIAHAINVVKVDWLHFDNLGVWPEPDSCHCRHCQEKFRQFLQAKYPTAEAQKHRFGFTGFDTFRAPNFFLRFTPPWKIDRFRNPLMQDWLDFRCWTVTDYIREMTQYGRSLKPDIAIDGNAQSIWGVNQSVLHGIDHEAQSQYLDIVCEENPDFRDDKEPGATPRTMRAMRGLNFYRRMGKSIMTGYRDEESLAFNLTFAGDPGINSQWGYAEPGHKVLNPHQPGVKELLDHFLRHRDLFLQLSAAARTAVWRSKLSLRYICTDTHLSAAVMEHVLFTHRVPFSIIMDNTLQADKLKDFDLVIVPNAEFISDEQIAVLTKFVEAGGSLLLTERSGTFDGDGRQRVKPAFGHLFAGGFSGSAIKSEETGDFDPHKQFAQRASAGLASTAKFGKGYVAYLPKIQYIHQPHAFKSEYNVEYDGIDCRYWKEPHNVQEVLDAVRWLLPDCQPVRVFGTPDLRMDYVRFSDGQRGATMFRHSTLAGGQDVRFGVLGPKEPVGGKLYRPDMPDGLDLKWVKRGEYYETVLPAVKRQAIVKFG